MSIFAHVRPTKNLLDGTLLSTCLSLLSKFLNLLWRCVTSFIKLFVFKVNKIEMKHIQAWIEEHACQRYTGCLKKMVIELWSAITRLLYNLQKSFFYSRKDQAFSFRMSPFLWNLKKDWANTSQMKIAGRNHIFPPLRIIIAANKKRKFH